MIELLLVEDNAADVRLLREALGETGLQLRLLHAADGESALRVLRGSANPPDVLVLDLNLPGMSGLELLAHLRAQPAWEILPVVMLSSSASPDDRQRALAARANTYFSKPERFEDLIELVEVIIRYWAATRLPGTKTDGPATAAGVLK